MNKKFKLLFLAISLTITSLISMSFVDNYFEIAKNLDIFTTLYKELNTFYVDETNPGDLMKKGIDEMLKSLDPYTNYIPESEIEDFRFQTTGQYGGIGAMITKVDDYVVISEPYENFPAQRAGLMAGDRIIEINGLSAKGKTTEEVSKVLKGQPNTSVTILIERPYLEKPFEISFNREKVSVASVPYSEYIDEGIAYIRLRSFTRNCAKDLKNAIVNLKKERELKGLILDLRGNPGGLLNESVEIVNLFVQKGEEVVSTKGKIKSWDKSYLQIKHH
jgi:carboxyl-terminal processing protease